MKTRAATKGDAEEFVDGLVDAWVQMPPLRDVRIEVRVYDRAGRELAAAVVESGKATP